MIEAVLGMVLLGVALIFLGVALIFYGWTKELDERIARLEKRDFERTEAAMREATERLHRTREGVE